MKPIHLFRALATTSLALALAASPAFPRGMDYTKQQPGEVAEKAERKAAIKDPIMVEEVQRTLNEKGYRSGSIDGELDENTRQALRDFQEAEGLETTGRINEETLAALNIETGFEKQAAGHAGELKKSKKKAKQQAGEAGAKEGC